MLAPPYRSVKANPATNPAFKVDLTLSFGLLYPLSLIDEIADCS